MDSGRGRNDWSRNDLGAKRPQFEKNMLGRPQKKKAKGKQQKDRLEREK